MIPDKNRGRKRTIQPISITRFWHRRITEATAFIALIILVLFALPYVFNEAAFAALLPVSYISAGLAGVTLITSIALYFVTPRHNLPIATLSLYTLVTVMIGSIILTTGEHASPFIGLWIGISVFAGVFSWHGFALIILLTTGYTVYAVVLQRPISALVIASLATVAPLVVSFIIWHSKSSKDTKQDKAYRELATELSHESNKSDTVINAINDGVIAVDKQGVIQLINPAATRIIGWGQNDALGLSYASVIKLRDKADKPVAPESDPITKVLATNQEVHSEDYSVSTESGKKILLSVVVSPLGQPATGAIMVFRDMTKEKAEEREQAEFISTASHEMRTPVASIEGYLGLALNPATATIDEKARDYIQKAQSSAQHLGRLFQDLLDVSKADDGRLSNNPNVVDVVSFVDDIAEGLKPKATEKNLHFIYKPTVDDSTSSNRKIMPVYYANVDNDHLREVVANLIENAIKYTLTGDVVVNVTGDETHVTISIQDSGIGIPTEDIPHLFQKFYRVDNSDTREIGGTGLGLYLCRRLAEVMGGRIQVESEYKKGSTFSLVLPRIESSEANRLLEAAATSEEMIQDRPIAAAPAPILEAEFIETTPQLITPPTPAPIPTEHPQIMPTTTPSIAAAPSMPITPAPTATLQQPVTTMPPPVTPQAQAPIAATSTPSSVAPRPGQDVLPRRPVTPQAPNIPLSQLEQNPGMYTAPRSNVQVPDRGATGTNQP